jgi:3'(2'), 5'-bisphosphate nucleotidase
MSTTHQHLAEGLFRPVLQAGRLQLAHRAAGIVAEQKSDKSPVTEADRASEDLLLAALAKLAPGIPVVAEESVAAGRIPADLGREYFLIDPLDGTREFIRGGDDFTVNVALVRDGTPTFGVVYAPARGWLCMTAAADRAVETEVAPDFAGGFADVSWRILSARRAPAEPLAVESRSHKSSTEDEYLDQLGIQKRTSIGSSLKFCLIARGEADIYPRFGPISEWDTGAGHAILLAAGGRVETRDGTPWVYGNKAGGFLAKPFIARGRG